MPHQTSNKKKKWSAADRIPSPIRESGDSTPTYRRPVIHLTEGEKAQKLLQEAAEQVAKEEADLADRMLTPINIQRLPTKRSNLTASPITSPIVRSSANSTKSLSQDSDGCCIIS